MNIMYWTSFLAVALILQCSIVSGWKCTIWEHPDYKGAKYDFEGTGCYNDVGNDLNDKASSIFTYGTCVRLYDHGYCKGKFIEVNPGMSQNQVSDFDNLGFADVTTSIGPCAA
uniref:Secreted protein n=1 Tax=Cacopsylla melanoneura TaxID=428564 RepID=A0A8D9BB11_9HEMI